MFVQFCYIYYIAGTVVVDWLISSLLNLRFTFYLHPTPTTCLFAFCILHFAPHCHHRCRTTVHCWCAFWLLVVIVAIYRYLYFIFWSFESTLNLHCLHVHVITFFYFCYFSRSFVLVRSLSFVQIFCTSSAYIVCPRFGAFCLQASRIYCGSFPLPFLLRVLFVLFSFSFCIHLLSFSSSFIVLLQFFLHSFVHFYVIYPLTQLLDYTTIPTPIRRAFCDYNLVTFSVPALVPVAVHDSRWSRSVWYGCHGFCLYFAFGLGWFLTILRSVILLLLQLRCCLLQQHGFWCWFS